MFLFLTRRKNKTAKIVGISWIFKSLKQSVLGSYPDDMKRSCSCGNRHEKLNSAPKGLLWRYKDARKPPFYSAETLKSEHFDAVGSLSGSANDSGAGSSGGTPLMNHRTLWDEDIVRHIKDCRCTCNHMGYGNYQDWEVRILKKKKVPCHPLTLYILCFSHKLPNYFSYLCRCSLCI